MNKSNLREYQSAAVDHILEHTHCGLFLEMGLGKTVSSLTALNTLMYEDLDIDTALIVGPKRVIESVWSDEIEKWEHLRHLTFSKINGTEKQRKAAIAAKADVYLVSRDNVAWLCGQFGGSMLPYDALIIDESSSFKNPKSQRFKALRMVQPSFERVVLLTGTPAPNSLIDLWAQLFLLDRGERLGKTITRYREDYFTPNQRSGHIVYNYKLKDEGEGRIHERIKDICLSMKTEDYLSLPEYIDNIIDVRFTQEIQDQYDEFERQQVIALFGDEDKEITAMNAAALSNKLLQYANGAIYDEDRNVHEVHDIKLEAAAEIVESADGKPVLIGWSYQHDRDRLMQKLKKYKPRELKNNQDIKDWNAGKIQVMLMHPASGGHGLNLQFGGHLIIWFGQTWSLELYQQFNARLRRPGQNETVIINRLVAHRTIETDVVKALEAKALKQDGLMDAVKARIKKHLR
jgi:SNF2 family DNA or RNA helicase